MRSASVVALGISVLCAADPDLRTLTVDCDATVRGGIYANDNFGGDPILMVKLDASPSWTRQIYLSWNVQERQNAWSGTPYQLSDWTGATLRLTPIALGSQANDSTFVIEFLGANGYGLEESTLTWNNRPFPLDGEPPVVASYSFSGSDLRMGRPFDIRIDAAWQQAFADADHQILALRIRSTTPGAERWVRFASDEHGAVDGPRLLAHSDVSDAWYDDWYLGSYERVLDLGSFASEGRAGQAYNRYGEDYYRIETTAPGLGISTDVATVIYPITHFTQNHEFYLANATISGRVVFTDGSDGAEGGISLREGLSTTDRHVSFTATNRQGLILRWRTTPGAKAQVLRIPEVNAPCYLRLIRSSDADFSAAYSIDGILWTTVKDLTIPCRGVRPLYLASAGSGNAQAIIDHAFFNGDAFPPIEDPSEEELLIDNDTYVRGGIFKDQQFGQDDIMMVKTDSAGYTREAYLHVNLRRRMIFGAPLFTQWPGASLHIATVAMGADAADTEFVAELIDLRSSDFSEYGWYEDMLTWILRPHGIVPVVSVPFSGQYFTPGSTTEIDLAPIWDYALREFPEAEITIRIRSLTPGAHRWIQFATKEHSAYPAPVLKENEGLAPVGNG